MDAKTTDIGRRLRALRTELDLSQEEVAQRAGVKQATISRIEAGKVRNMPFWVVRQIERALGLPVGALETDPEPHPSLAQFLESDLARSLQPPLSPEEVTLLRVTRWYAPGEEPTIASWYEFVRARRSLRRRE